MVLTPLITVTWDLLQVRQCFSDMSAEWKFGSLLFGFLLHFTGSFGTIVVIHIGAR